MGRANVRRVVRRTVRKPKRPTGSTGPWSRIGKAPEGWNGSRLRLARALTSETAAQLAEAVGIPRSTLLAMETKPLAGPRPDELERLAAHFGVEPAFFSGRTLTLADISAIR